MELLRQLFPLYAVSHFPVLFGLMVLHLILDR